MKKPTVRNIELCDYEVLNTWWEGNGYQMPSLEDLPEEGLGGHVVETDKPIAAGFIYLTNSNKGYVDFVISDPRYKGKDRYELILKLIEHCLDYALDLGCRSVWAMTRSNGIIKRCKELGYSVTTKDYSIVASYKIK